MKITTNRVFSKLGVFFLLNLPVILLYFMVVLLLRFPVVSELLTSLIVSSVSFADIFDILLYSLYVICYYLILALSIVKNSSARTQYLNKSAGQLYSLKNDMIGYVRTDLLTDFISAAVLAILSFAVLGFLGNSSIVRLAFITQYSISKLFGNIGAHIFYLIFTPMFTFLLTVFSQYIWNKKRLGGKTTE